LILRKKYDLIICFEVLEHLHEDLKLLKLINSWLKDDGILLISVPHNEKLWNIRDELADHLRRYSKDEIKAKLKSANLEPKYYVMVFHSSDYYLEPI